MFAWPSEFIVHRFRKLGFCAISFNATLALVGQLCKTLHRASIGSVPTLEGDIHTYWSQRHAMLMLHLVFRPRIESDQLSLNDIFMRLATQHNSTTGGHNEMSTPLVSWHVITSSGTSPPCFHGLVTPLCIGFIN